METKSFIDKVLSFARQSLEPEALCRDISPCEHYSVADLERYLEGALPEAEMNAYETHCLDCFACAVRLIQNQERAEDGLLFMKTMELLDQLEKEKKSHLMALTEDICSSTFAIVLETAKDVFRVLSTTGKILSLASAATVRGEIEKIQEKKPIQIIQEFAQPKVSIQASISREGPDTAEVRISLLNRETEEFMTGVAARLYAGTVMEKEAVTDENGEAVFIIHFEHDYTIELLSGETRIGQVNLLMST